MTGNHKILLINRSEEFLEATANILKQEGYVVQTAMALKEALSVLSSDKVDLIICDSVLQDIAGHQLLKFLKNDPFRKSIPFVFFVSLSDQGQPLEAMEQGAVDYIVYPLEPKIFLNRIEKVIHASTLAEEKTVLVKEKEVIPSSPFKTAPPPQEEQRRTEPSHPPSPLPAEVSPDGHLWMPGNILDYNASRAFVETAILGKLGERLKVKCSLPQGTITVQGRIVRVIYENFEDPGGIGMDFDGESGWQLIYEHLDSITRSAKEIAPDEKPVTRSYLVTHGEKSRELTVVIANPLEKKETLRVELSIDGYQWTSGYLLDYNVSRAFVETTILGKLGQSLKIRCSLPQGSVTVNGQVASVICNDFEQPVGIGLDFNGESGWQGIYERLNSITRSAKEVVPDEKPVTKSPPPMQGVEKFQDRTMVISKPLEKKETFPADVSADGCLWMPGKILDYSASRAFVETAILGKLGQSLKIRCSLPQGSVTVNGQVANVICNDFEQPVGIGLDFNGESGWQGIYGHLDSITRSAKEIAPDEKPVTKSPLPMQEVEEFQDRTMVISKPLEKKETFPADVSADGCLWMPGKILDYSASRAFVETAILGKLGQSLKIRCSLPQGSVTVNGQVANVICNDFEQPVGIGLGFNGESGWQGICEHLDSVAGSTTISAPDEKPVAESPPPINVEKPQDSAMMITHTRSKKETLRTRFYHSLIGKQLDQYKVVSFLGSGAMGGVFKGWDATLEREVALKVISYELSSQDTFVEMFFREARFVSKLNHPNISHIYSIGNTNHILYHAMEFIAGDTLSLMLKKQGNLNTLEAVSYFITICQALDFISKENIIHRDIKPENIIVNERGQVKLVDFGVAKRIDTTALEGKEDNAIVGSPLYISPESILGHRMDHRSDIYSLGATFCHVFSGSPPYNGDDVEEVLYKHTHASIPILNERNSNVSPILCSIIEKMLAKNPKDRYQDYKDIISELRSYYRDAVKVIDVKPF